MNPGTQFVSKAVLFMLLLVVFQVGCTSEQTTSPSPAHIDNPTVEAALTTVHLTEQAEQRIGIELTTVGSESVLQHRTYGGVLMAASGSAVTVGAPRVSRVLPPEGGRIPVAGDRVERGQPLVRLVGIPVDPARAREEAATAEARVANAREKAARARRLLDKGVGSRSDWEDANAELDAAEAGVRAATARLGLLESGNLPDDEDLLSPVILRSPASGVVMAVHAAQGQIVAEGAALIEIVDADPLWVRVPVYPGDRSGIDDRRMAIV